MAENRGALPEHLYLPDLHCGIFKLLLPFMISCPAVTHMMLLTRHARDKVLEHYPKRTSPDS
jgi:hypothetical protein